MAWPELRLGRRGAVLASTYALAAVAGLSGCRQGYGAGSLRTVFMGDSITWGGSDSITGAPGRDSWVRYALDDPACPWRLAANVAVNGETLGDMRARFRGDVLDREPEAVVLMGGINDIFQQVPLPHSLADLGSMVRSAKDAGARVWVVGYPPMGRHRNAHWTSLLRAEATLARELDVPFLRTDRTVSNPATGSWVPSYTDDWVHPNRAGAKRIGHEVMRRLPSAG